MRETENPDARLHAAWEAAMRRGDFAAAHRVSAEVRATRPVPDARTTPRHQQRVWDGRPIDHRVVLVRCYHGLGDTIMFARFLPMLAARAARVIVWAPTPLLPLLRTIRSATPFDLLPLHDGVPGVAYDVDIEIMELADLLGVTTTMLPATVPYLHVAPLAADDPSAPMAHADAARASRHVGIVWSASAWAPERSLHVSAIVPLLDVPGVTWHSLQHGAGIFGLGATLPVTPAGSLVATARRMQALDLVVTVDSMPAHLAGALGRPVWTLLPHAADWRWMADRDDSPWYPSMRLFRQPAPGAWRAVIAAVAEALETGD